MKKKDKEEKQKKAKHVEEEKIKSVMEYELKNKRIGGHKLILKDYEDDQ